MHFPGHYCLVNTTTDTEYPCPKGTYNNKTGAQESNACVLCAAGTYCQDTGRTEEGVDCNAGHYCTGTYLF